MNQCCVLAMDMGGTYLKCAFVFADGTLAGETLVVPVNSGGTLQAIRDSWRQAIDQLQARAAALHLSVEGVGISIPGPFDFVAGKSLMQQKYQAIYGLPLVEELRQLGLAADLPVRFIHDANAFLAGEHLCGAACGCDDVACVTLGTGLGFTTMVNGRLMTNGRGGPYIALYRQPFGDGVLEDVVSARGICADYLRRAGLPADEPVTAKDVGQLAKGGDIFAQETMAALGQTLGSQMAYLLIHTHCQRLVLGGQISRDFALFECALRRSLSQVESLDAIVQAAHPQDAALFGAASLYFSQQPNLI